MDASFFNCSSLEDWKQRTIVSSAECCTKHNMKHTEHYRTFHETLTKNIEHRLELFAFAFNEKMIMDYCLQALLKVVQNIDIYLHRTLQKKELFCVCISCVVLCCIVFLHQWTIVLLNGFSPQSFPRGWH